MANNYDAEQPDPWDYASFYKEASAAFDYEGMYPSAPLDDTIPVQFNDELAQYSPNLFLGPEPSPSPAAQSQMPTGLHSDQKSSGIRSTSSSKVAIPPARQQARKVRNPPSAEAVARRRQQNRASQLAFRERSKREVDTLKQDLADCTEENQKMYTTMRGLLERTETLKLAIEEALEAHKPRTYRSMSAKSGADFENSPQSSSDGNALTYGSNG